MVIDLLVAVYTQFVKYAKFKLEFVRNLYFHIFLFPSLVVKNITSKILGLEHLLFKKILGYQLSYISHSKFYISHDSS